MSPELLEKTQALSDWIVNEALEAGLDDYNAIFSQFCERLLDCGVPLFRVHVAMQTLHPMINAISLTWYRGEETVMREHRHEVDAEQSEAWERNPLKALIDAGESLVYHPLPPDEETAVRYPLLQELAEKGATGYLGFAVRFSPGEIARQRQGGMIASLTTDAPGGYSEEHVEAISRVLPRFALVAKLAGRERLFSNVLEAYLGGDAGRRVREGQIALGSGQVIDAVIWFSDLRESTPLAERLGHDRFLAMLNDYFSALAGSVLDHGGQVLRFVGDAALAVFPIAPDAFGEGEARQSALAAARSAVARASSVNAERLARGDESFDFGIGLHVGRIMYGNIGVPTRVEFSVIGAAANEAARIEAQCKVLGEKVVVSETFAEGSGEKWRNLGCHALRGTSQPVSLFGLAS